MPVPIICLDDELRHFVERFREQFSKPQYQYFVTVLLGLMLCGGRRTLSGLLREVAGPGSLYGLSRFLSEAPWSQQNLATSWLSHFRQEMQFVVQAERHRQQSQQPKRRGRPKQPLVIGDDSTVAKPKGRKMAGLGTHHSTTEDRRITGHSLVQGLYVLLGRSCPLAPQLYRQEAVCAMEDVTFQSKIEQMERLISTFGPVAVTVTHLLLDSWYCAKRLWRAARERDFLITTGLKSNRWLRVADETVEQGWRWQKLSDYVAGLNEQDYVPVKWQGGLYACAHHLGAQALSLPGRDRASGAFCPTGTGTLLGFE